jgi:hypothetical protein
MLPWEIRFAAIASDLRRSRRADLGRRLTDNRLPGEETATAPLGADLDQIREDRERRQWPQT